MFISAPQAIRCSLNLNESIHVLSAGGVEKKKLDILDVYAWMRMKRIRISYCRRDYDVRLL